MPQARKPASSARVRAAFKPPAAMKQLSTSLDAANKALAELRKDASRDVSGGAHDIYSGLRTFVTSARKDSNKLAKALQRDFEQAQKQLAKATASARSRSSGRQAGSGASSSRSSSSGGSSARGTAKRSTAKRSTAKRSTAKRSTGGRGSAKS